MKKYEKILLGLVCIISLSSCADEFLNLNPLDFESESSYFDKPADFNSAANDFYDKMLGWNNASPEYLDWGTDLNAWPQDYGRGVVTVPTSEAFYNNAYRYIRSTNILLKKASEYKGNKTEIAQYVAAAKFFRAYHYFFLLQRYGGVTLVTSVMDVNSPELTAPRNSRYEVVQQILKDLTEAIPDLPKESSIALKDKGHISSGAAKALKAKVLLYEGTWEKYVGTSTDGDGITKGAGSAGKDLISVDQYLTQAIEMSKEVIDDTSYEIWNYNSVLNNQSSHYLFVLEDANSNPAGLTKDSNKEFILYSKFDYNLRRAGAAIAFGAAGRLAGSRKLMDMFLAIDGLPIEKSSTFQGYVNTSDEYKNRDYRMTSYFGFPANGAFLLFGPMQGSGAGSTCIKFTSYNYPTYRPDGAESMDYPIIRLAEIYLLYAEALYEKNGSISDADLNLTVNKVRNRAGLPPLTNAFVTANGLNMLNEIRRERTIELYGENSRFNDLKRWGIAETTLNQDIQAAVIQGTNYENNPALYKPASYPYGEKAVQTPKGLLKALLIDPATNRKFKRDNYLWPLPSDQLNLNKKLLQNSGY